ncbi:ABC transporter substrate-binding protein [Marinibaculum pumilum]|uniref:ABC transporter substrate-binding protein n=1 Tax=Marinibaculum pumilum TaxID=1766165 RepID=A0ABV7L026_9PROT
MRPIVSALGLSLLIATAAPVLAADEVELLPDGLMTPTTEEMVPADKYKKDPPWTIGMSFGGVGNSWIVQMIQEAKYVAAQNPKIGEFIFVEANWQPAKQVSDMEDLITRKVDALIVGPIAFPLVKTQVDAAIAAGIPVITFGVSDGELNSTTEIMGGGEEFGRVGGEFLRDKLGGEGTVWAFRGVAGVGEETLRYNGFVKSLEGSDIKIGAEVFGDWNYAKGKQLCENLVLSGQPVDGIWFSGAEMTRACIDVFQDTGKPMVPMTGEGNNGFLKVWSESGIDSVAPVFTPGLGPAVVRAAVALLEGKPVYKTYFSSPPPITNANLSDYVRDDLNDAFWVPSTLPEDEIQKTFKR